MQKTITINKEELINELLECSWNAPIRVKISPVSGEYTINLSDNSSTYTEVEGKQIFWEQFDLISGFENWSENVSDEEIEEFGQTREEYEEEVKRDWLQEVLEEHIDAINYSNSEDEEAPVYELI